jgi:hypothetical protein
MKVQKKCILPFFSGSPVKEGSISGKIREFELNSGEKVETNEVTGYR